jgi:hypothetical protein
LFFRYRENVPILAAFRVGDRFLKNSRPPFYSGRFCARAVPMAPVDAPMIAAGLPFQALSPWGSL